MKDYKLIIFDCDGVLVDSEMISAEIIADVLRPIGINLTTEESYKKFVGGSMSKTLSYVEEQLGYMPDVDIEGEYRRLSFSAYREKMKPVKGVVNILNSLNIEKCVASNGPKSKIDLNLKVTNLDKFFDPNRIFSAYDIQKWKPDPTLYLNAAEVCGIAPSQCIVIEDSVHGLMAAEAAGMKSFGISYPIKPLPKNIKGSNIFSSMHMIQEQLENLGLTK